MILRTRHAWSSSSEPAAPEPCRTDAGEAASATGLTVEGWPGLGCWCRRDDCLTSARHLMAQMGPAHASTDPVLAAQWRTGGRAPAAALRCTGRVLDDPGGDRVGRGTERVFRSSAPVPIKQVSSCSPSLSTGPGSVRWPAASLRRRTPHPGWPRRAARAEAPGGRPDPAAVSGRPTREHWPNQADRRQPPAAGLLGYRKAPQGTWGPGAPKRTSPCIPSPSWKRQRNRSLASPRGALIVTRSVLRGRTDTSMPVPSTVNVCLERYSERFGSAFLV